MEYPVHIAGFEGRDLVLKTGGFLSGAKVWIDGQPAPKGPKRGEMLLRRNDGTEVAIKLNNANFFDPVPTIMVEGPKINVVEPLKWYQRAWCAIPILLILVGGALGGGTGGAAVVINGWIFRTEMSEPLKFLATGFVSFCAVIGYLVLAVLLQLFVFN